MSFECTACGYCGGNVYNYRAHLKTKKHAKNCPPKHLPVIVCADKKVDAAEVVLVEAADAVGMRARDELLDRFEARSAAIVKFGLKEKMEKMTEKEKKANHALWMFLRTAVLVNMLYASEDAEYQNIGKLGVEGRFSTMPRAQREAWKDFAGEYGCFVY